ncbi:uncharacterized protein BDW43DRAFT_312618 [Aspergillus alliaceus]|uniref:uncharacterized protein n=1 Tax=Petromyces alliaceus TaxID=209559 RepID=UPI0012A75A34|nr:uncharacterized protein BDW43DRAFT_312618 [Aspergillus alliaceus]KAB8232002.1 hypothetical protein BDW43DRAFT_312618 [Aspergillus alliaceus]
MKTITIVGTTGNQGLSVAETFLSLPDWHTSDLSDVSSLRPAFANANVIFANTDFWGSYRASGSSDEAYAVEVQHGRNAAIAATGIPTLERFIYSALMPLKKYSHGKYSHVYRCDTKAEIMEYIETEMPELAKKTWDPSARNYRFTVPLKKGQRIPIIGARESTGAFVRALVDEAPQTRLLAYDSESSIEEIVEVWSRATGHKADLVEMDLEEMHEKLGIPWEVLDAFGYIAEYGYAAGIEGVISPSQLKMPVQTDSFEEWLKKRDWKDVVSGGEGEWDGVVGAPRA